VANQESLTEFQVINIESNDDNSFNTSRTALRFKFSFVRLEVRRCQDGQIFMVNSHLGESLDLNDIVLAYDLTRLNLHNTKNEIPQVVIVKKAYPMFRANLKERYWNINHIDKGADIEKEYAEQVEFYL
jgi:nonsense-mediated mRNA decay protein 3